MIRSTSLICTLLLSAAAVAAPQPIEIPFIEQAAIIDGKIDEPIWQSAQEILIDNVTWPHENIASPVSTKALVYENGEALFIAFIAKDPTPKEIRAHYRDRDKIWNDDLVGLKIDSLNTSQNAYQFFINPLGVQLDSIENELTKNENSSWNGIWSSKGEITPDGYRVEVKIPLRVLNFNDSQGTKQMAMEFLRFLPRDERLRISNMQLDHNNSCWICQMPAVSGFASAKQSNNLTITPALAIAHTQTRDIDDAVVPDFESDTDYEPGLDVKWAVTPDTTLNLTVNPDFSQVEVDTGQLSVNNSFSLFFPEKRAFFLENSDYFSSHLNLVHTRNVSAPDYGIKATSSKQGHTFAGFIANDDSTHVLVPGNLGSSIVSLEQKSENAALRYRYDANDQLSIGTTGTIRQSEDYRNQVLSIDSKYRPTKHDTIKLQAITTDTQYDQHFIDEVCDDDPIESCEIDESVLRVQNHGDQQGLGYYASYEHNRKHWRAFGSYRNYDAALRADLGFISQVDFNKFITGFEYRWYGDESNWWNRANWYSDWDISHNEDGELLEKEVQSNFKVQGPLQSIVQVGFDHRKRTGQRHDETLLEIDGNTDMFTENFQWMYLEMKPRAGVFAGLRLNTGNKLDIANNRLGQRYIVKPTLNFNLGRHFEVKLRHTYERLEHDGENVYTANLSDARFTYQFGINSYVRLALINLDIERNQHKYIDDVDSRYKKLSTQLLYAYKLNPETVLFVGYSDSGYQDDDLSDITKDNKTFFAKFSYAWLR
ncbi:carbohydrate binding family 9 domain-containing protein [Pseudoalteromonas luteoviolacea]|uniref:carbohydrate binding family 9 domain-containing protein n=1 Tax=Pseudoalteromonas luteoviolacea TaxID=43657 RepID=UPI001B394262|nr:carbohydrate binding family 9 domain-containing protein [Pseudoalteromonas luteoviolacea]MBQ4835976.1 carbohydrate binding family 9 domain-containing protein [Pseudoalteromonas luteoviolacea]